LRTALAILKVLRRLWPVEFAWRPPPYEYESTRPAIEILAGSRKVPTQIEADIPLAEIEETWRDDLSRFLNVREHYLLY
jgi:uncharacterized protein YbbC (DUF1343 family)